MPRGPEQRAGDEKADSRSPQRFEGTLDEMLEENADQTGGDHPDDEQAGVADRIRSPAKHIDNELPEPPAVDHEDGSQRRDVQRDLDEDARSPHAGHMADHREMPVTRDRQELGKSLHETEQNGLPEIHATFPATSATSPITMAPLSNALTRSTFPKISHVAATSTASCANSAIR